ncbi:MAG: hypothetical protein ACRD1M_06010 [Terriglobales bacterium]
MRRPMQGRWMAIAALACGLGVAAGAQTPVPDPVQGLPDVLQAPDLRTTALAFLQGAQQDLDLRRNGMPGFSLKASFQAGGNLPYTGAGTLEEDWIDGADWMWKATLGGAVVDRYNGARTTNPAAPIPLRVKMVRLALTRAGEAPGAAGGSIRSAKARWQGTPVVCYLFAGAKATLPPLGRAEVEKEFCFDSQSSLLLEWSPVPGVYYSYGYSGGSLFQGHRLPRSIAVNEGGVVVLSIQVDSVTPLQAIAPAPAPLARGSSMQSPVVRWVTWGLPPGAASHAPQQVLMHVSTDAASIITESELVGYADPALVKVVQSRLPNFSRFGPISSNPNVGIQHELYLGVNFLPSSVAAPPPLPPISPAPDTPNGLRAYDGIQVTSTVETLVDGNVVETSYSRRMARDAQGRTYSESANLNLRERVYSIFDPVARVIIQVYPQRKFAIERSMDIAAAGVGQVVNGVKLPPLPGPQPTFVLQNRPVTTTTSLGTQEVDGVSATGTRMTEVYAAGAVGNRDPLTVVRETWRSPDLGMMLKTVNNDPRKGVTTTEFQDLQVGEPSPDLFAIPAGYTVVDQNGKLLSAPADVSGGGRR